MNTYENEIKEATEKIAQLNKRGSKYTASLVQTDLNRLQKAIKNNNESDANKAVEVLAGYHKITVDHSEKGPTNNIIDKKN